MYRRGLLTASLSLPFAAHASPVTPVVLELFTSQGCSSCPPADALLGELTKRPGVIGLAWHVDYWNGLGWRDPFAKPEWTQRQQSYATHLRGEVYTPALVVNGAAMVVGSDRSAVLQAIDTATPPAVNVTLRRASSGLTMEMGATATPVSGLLATYDREQTTQVGAGENQGRRLVDYRVVREVTRLDALATRMVLPMVPDDRGVVLLVQDASWRVIGAAELPPAAKS